MKCVVVNFRFHLQVHQLHVSEMPALNIPGPTSAQLIFPRSDPSVSHLTSPHRASCLTVYQDIDVANLDIIFHASAWACAVIFIEVLCRGCWCLINRNFILLCSLLYLVYRISISYRPVNFVQVLCKKDSGVCVGKLVWSVESDF